MGPGLRRGDEINKNCDMNKILLKSFPIWIPFAALLTFACFFSYGLVQQDLRQTANDPQIQIVEDISQALASGGATPQDIVPPGQTLDISTSLDSYVIVYDATGAVLASSATLNGKTPTVPQGVFASLRRYGIDNAQNRFTWEPAPGVRSAAVVTAFSGPASSSQGFVLAGRSLREVEIREDNMLRITVLAWLAGLVGMFLIIWFAIWIYKKEVVSNQ
jgi:hypothetical protein